MTVLTSGFAPGRRATSKSFNSAPSMGRSSFAGTGSFSSSAGRPAVAARASPAAFDFRLGGLFQKSDADGPQSSFHRQPELRPIHVASDPLPVAGRAGRQHDPDQIFGIDGEVILERQTAARIERQIGADAIEP